MSNVVYAKKLTRGVLVQLLVRDQMPMAQAAKYLKVPYNCLRFQAIKKLSDKQWAVVVKSRDRRTYSDTQKRWAVQKAQELQLKLYKEGKAPTMKDAGVRAFKSIATKYELRLSLLMSWRRMYQEQEQKKEPKANAKKKSVNV